MRVLLVSVACVLSMSAVSTARKAVVKVDNATWSADTILEGGREAVSHSFVLKNTGDEVLKIKAVRPG